MTRRDTKAETGPAALAGHPVFADGLFRGHHLLEADAGTGKTWTLAGLFVRALIEARLEVDRILVVTFTRAASAELRARIADLLGRLQQAFEDRRQQRSVQTGDPFVDGYPECCPVPADEVIAILRVAATELDRASIQTIHGYCRRALGEHPLALAMPAGAEVVDRTARGIRPEIARWWLEQTVGHPDPSWSNFLLSSTSLARLTAAVQLARMRPGIDFGQGRTDWDTWRAAWGAARATLARALRDEAEPLALRLATGTGINRRRLAPVRVAEWLQQVSAFLAGDEFGFDIPGGLERLGRDNLALACDGGIVAVDALGFGLPRACDHIRQLVDQRLAVIAARMPDLLDRLNASIAERAARSGQIDADQLLLLTRDSLVRPLAGARLAGRLADRHPLALIDECQDNDPLQWQILHAVYPPTRADRHGLILVGDPKQTIYDFRGADVFAYLDAAERGKTRHRLGANQRSSPALLAGLNRLFTRERPFLIDGLRFEPAIAGNRPRSRLVHATGRDAVAWRWVELAADDGGPGEDPRGRGGGGRGDPDELDADHDGSGNDTLTRRCAQAVAGEIVRLLGPQAERIVEPDGTVRALRPADIAVLVSSHAQGHQVKQALAERSIGAVQLGLDSVLLSPEADELARVVAAIDDPAAAGLVRGALLSTLLGIDAARLQASAADAGQWASLVERFAQARLRWAASGPQAALRGLLREFGSFERLAGTSRGERALTNLLHLLDLFGRSHDAAAGPAHALRWLARQRDTGASEEAELRLESDERLVHILTIHKSKGLEYPVVFVPFSWTAPARPEAPLLVHERGPDGWRTRLWLDRPPPDVRARAELEARSEALRRLYVAATRAMLRLYCFWGATRGAARSPLGWLLHGIDGEDGGPRVLTDGDVDRVLDAFVDALPGVADRVRLSSLIDAESGASRNAFAHGTSGTGASGATGVLSARRFERSIPAPWQRTSFTRLTRGDAGWSIDRPEHDEFGLQGLPANADDLAAGVEPPSRRLSTPALDSDSDFGIDAAVEAIRWRFPAGAEAGTCLHAILESADFDRGVDAADVEPALHRSGFDPTLAPAVADWLSAVLDAPLVARRTGPLRLAAVARADTMRELGFSLAGGPVHTHALIERVHRDYPIAAALEAGAPDQCWAGYLRGFIDLVVRDQGRYWIVDWKSNHLGDMPGAYTQGALARVMARHAYPLQFVLYTLALHRLLAVRLPDYDYERTIGGVCYVFLRGAGTAAVAATDAASGAASDAASDVASAGLGVYVSRPPRRLIEDLDRMLRGEAGTGSTTGSTRPPAERGLGRR